jgi:predicted transport protein
MRSRLKASVPAPRRARPLWRCAECGRSFANRNQSHFCGELDLERHFAGKSPLARELYETFLRKLKELGPVIVLPEKTRIAFQTRMSFAQITPRKNWLVGHLVLARRIASKKFHKIETISRRNHVHHFRIESPEDIDVELIRFMAEAYAVGNQEHLDE